MRAQGGARPVSLGDAMLQATVSDAGPVTVKAVLAGSADVVGTVTGTTFTIALPAGAIDLAGKDVSVVATDAAGNQKTVVQRIRVDVTAPQLSFQASTVLDEATESAPAFTEGGGALSDEAPIHRHDGPAVNLAVAGACPVVTKYSYLLGSTGPRYGVEIDSQGNARRNPIRYGLVTSDDGVGIAAGSTQYRVGRRDASGTTVFLTSFLSTGSGTPLGGGATAFDVGVFSDVVPGLARTEGTYDVQFRSTDRLSRTTTVSRCFELRLRAPPLNFAPRTTLGMGVPGPASGHKFALQTLSLAAGATFDLIAERLLNATASASLLDQPFTNGTAETVFLTVTITGKPSESGSQRFALRNFVTTTTANINCDTNPTGCNPPVFGPTFVGETSFPATALPLTVKLFELDGNNVPTTEIAPLAVSGDVYKFAVPPRGGAAAGAPFRRFKAMTMLGQVSGLWPRDAAHEASAPFSDTSVNGVRITGRASTTTGCVSTDIKCLPVGDPDCALTCTKRTTVTAYRALTRAQLTFSAATTSSCATSPTETIAPRLDATANRAGALSWSTDEQTTLP